VFFIKKLNSNIGYSLIELSVVLAIMGLIGLGTATLMKNIYEIQRVQESKVGLLEFSKSLQLALRSETNWQATINHPTNNPDLPLTCQRVGTTAPNYCLHNGASGTFNVYLQGPTLFYVSRTATDGLDFSGAPCTTFPSNNCPFRLNLSVINICTNGETRCANPQTRITGDLIKANIDDPVIRKTDDRTAALGGTISFEILRGKNTLYEPFEIVNLSDATGAIGGGTCTGFLNQWRVRSLTTVLSNTGNNMNLAANTFNVQPGTYECTISAVGFDQESGFKIRLRDTGGTIYEIGSAITGDLASATIVGKVELRPVAAIGYTVEHYCGTIPANDPVIPATDMGRPLPNYADQTVFTRVYCVRTL
jgi:prepilin-type N-terminal cleavage/methylation domain-containing protein